MSVSVRRSLAAMLLILATACGGGPSVAVNYDPAGAGLAASYQTWGWLPHPGGQDTRPVAAAWTERIQTLVERALLDRGFVRRDSVPDFQVGWHVVTGESLEATAISLYYGYTWGRWFPGGGVSYPGGYQAEFEPGTVIVEVVDRPSGELAWRGYTRIDLAERDRARQDQTLREALRRMFERFPPRT